MRSFLPFLLFTCTLVKAQKVTLLSSYLDEFQNVRDFCINNNTNEAYFTIQSPNQDISQIVCVKNKDWQHPQLLSFCEEFAYMEPFLSPDGLKLFFASNRPKTDTSHLPGDYDIWYVSRTGIEDPWSAPVNAGSPVNTPEDEFYPVTTLNRNLYLTKDSKKGLGKDDIYFCQWNGLAYEAPVLLGTEINSEGYEFNAYVSPDESFIIFTRYNAKGGYGSGDLYIAKKDAQGNWTGAVNMGSEINSPFMEYCPYYDDNSQTLYFTSKRNTLSPQKFSDLNAYNDYIKKGENGLSKIYQYSIKL